MFPKIPHGKRLEDAGQGHSENTRPASFHCIHAVERSIRYSQYACGRSNLCLLSFVSVSRAPQERCEVAKQQPTMSALTVAAGEKKRTESLLAWSPLT